MSGSREDEQENSEEGMERGRCGWRVEMDESREVDQGQGQGLGER